MIYIVFYSACISASDIQVQNLLPFLQQCQTCCVMPSWQWKKALLLGGMNHMSSNLQTILFLPWLRLCIRFDFLLDMLSFFLHLNIFCIAKFVLINVFFRSLKQKFFRVCWNQSMIACRFLFVHDASITWFELLSFYLSIRFALELLLPNSNITIHPYNRL